MYSKKIVIRYEADIVDKPVVYSLVKDFDLAFNIMRARVSPRREGLVVSIFPAKRETLTGPSVTSRIWA